MYIIIIIIIHVLLQMLKMIELISHATVNYFIMNKVDVIGSGVLGGGGGGGRAHAFNWMHAGCVCVCVCGGGMLACVLLGKCVCSYVFVSV